MSDIFISYSRKDIAYARLLHKALKENDLETWIDWQDIPPSTEWLKEIYKAIEEANTFIFILSASSALSDVCVKEIEHASENSKRIIPIVIDDVNPSKVHPALAAINWIFSRTKDELQPAIDSLIEAIQTDYDWVKAHTRLQVRALEWERADYDRSFLLHGTDLQQAENWLVESVDKKPEPTLRQTRYIQASRQSAVKSQRRLLLSVAGALVITIALGVLAFINGQRATQNANSFATQVVIAEENARLARIRELTMVSQQGDIRFDIAMLLGLETYNSMDNFQTRSNLFNLAQLNPQVKKIIRDRANCLAFSPDGKILASGSSETPMIHLWDTTTGQELTGSPFHGHFERVISLAFSPNGKVLASGGDDSQIILWDMEKMHSIGSPLQGHKQWVQSLAFSPDGNILASAGEDSTIVLWDMINKKIISDELYEDAGRIHTIAFSPDGHTVAFAGQDQKIRLLDTTTVQLIGEPLSGHKMTILSIAFSPDGNILASAGEDRTIILWDIKNRQPIGDPISGFSSGISSLAFSPDGTTLAAASWDNTVSLWDVKSRQPAGEPLLAHINRVSDIAYSPDGKTLASASQDGTILLWSLEQIIPMGEQLIAGENGGIENGAFSDNGNLLWIVQDNNIVLWNMKTVQKLGILPHSDFYPYQIVLLATNFDGSRVATISEEGTLVLWDTTNGQRIFDANTGYSGDNARFGISPSGNLIAVSETNEQGSEITLWEMIDGEPVSKTLKLAKVSNLTNLVFSPDENNLVIGRDEGLIIWDLVEEKESKFIPTKHTDWMNSISFSQEGNILASVGGGTIVLWDASSWKAISEPLPAFVDQIMQVKISPDGKTMVTTGSDGTFVLWDIETQQPMGKTVNLLESNEAVLDIVYVNEGKTLLALFADGSVISWDISPEAWVSQLCEKVGRNFTQEEWAFYFPDESYQKTCEQWPEGK